MISFGHYLQSLREEKGLTLEEIAEKTNIRITILRDIEAGNWSQLPEPVFLRGMLRSYATVFSINPQEIISRYHMAIGEPLATKAIGQAPRVGFPFVKRKKNHLFKIFIWLLVLIALVLLGIRIASLVSDLPANQTEMRTSEKKTSFSSENKPSLLKSELISLQVTATEKAWIRIKQDEKSIDYLLNSGETVQLTLPLTSTIVFGNAGGIQITHNNKVLPLFGKSGEVRTATLSSILSQETQ